MANSENHQPWPLGPVLEGARKRLGLSRKEAARRAGISDTLLQTLERGYELRRGVRFDVNPGPDRVIAVARVVGVDPREALRLARLPTDTLDEKPPAAPHEAFEAFESLYLTFEKAWGPVAAREAMRRVWQARNSPPTETPDQADGSTTSASG